MAEIRISKKEMVDAAFRGEAFVRIMLKEKGLPMSGNFYPQLELNKYTYSVYDEQETGDRIYKYEPIDQ